MWKTNEPPDVLVVFSFIDLLDVLTINKKENTL